MQFNVNSIHFDIYILEILDENDNQPTFEQENYLVSIPYDSHPGKSSQNTQLHTKFYFD